MQGIFMLNYIWAAMILVGIVYAVLTGNIASVTEAMLDSAGEGISLCITMAGVVAFWMGLMEIAKEAGLIEKMTKGLLPILKYCFPNIPKGHPALEYIASNVIANILGLGWACTPAGLKAMEALAQLEAERGNAAYEEDAAYAHGMGHKENVMYTAGAGREDNAIYANDTGCEDNEYTKQSNSTSCVRAASNEMCTFLILNISSLQLIPVNIIAYRSQYGSSHPAEIIGPAIAATLVSTLAAVVFCKVMDGKKS